MAAPSTKDRVEPSSSSDSDQEQKRRLQSSVWEFGNGTTKEKTGLPSRPSNEPPSRRENSQDSLNVTDDYRVTATTPEYKRFVAKKLTAYLDSFVKDVEKDEDKWKVKAVAKPAEDDCFRLFSTSSHTYVPPRVCYPQPAWKRKKKRKEGRSDDRSSSSSDSDEEQQRLLAAAVTGHSILEGSRGHLHGNQVEEEESDQVTSDPHSSILSHDATHPGETHKKLKEGKNGKCDKEHLEHKLNNGEDKPTKTYKVEDDNVVKKKKKKRKKEKSFGQGHNHDDVKIQDVDESLDFQSVNGTDNLTRTDEDDTVVRKKRKKREKERKSFDQGHNHDDVKIQDVNESLDSQSDGIPERETVAVGAKMCRPNLNLGGEQVSQTESGERQQKSSKRKKKEHHRGKE